MGHSLRGIHPLKWLEEGAFDAQGIRPVPSKVFLRKLGSLNAEQLAIAEATIAAWFNLKQFGLDA